MYPENASLCGQLRGGPEHSWATCDDAQRRLAGNWGRGSALAVVVNVIVLSFSLAITAFAQPSAPAPGEVMYREGLLPSGQPLRGDRAGGVAVEGSDAACVKCHRRSGLGTSEGRIIISPITARYLFRPNGKAPEDMDYRFGLDAAAKHEPYTDATLARAIREGIGSDGRQLDYLMPRYRLDAATTGALIAYLKGLSSATSPGIDTDTLHIATVITPDADRVQRKGMLDVLERFIADKNAAILAAERRALASPEAAYRITRRWQLHVWDLSGEPDTWERQLHERVSAQPVFAVLSGLGGKTWAPVHRFCESESIPCLFPNTELPVLAESDFYALYFSKGVVLEAQLLARRLHDSRGPVQRKRLVQIFRHEDIGKDAADALRVEARSLALDPVERPLKTNATAAELAEALNDVRAGDVLMLWLRPADLARLPPQRAPGPAVFFSGLMGGLENSPLPAAWRQNSSMTYPFDLPDLRKVRMNFPLGWLKAKNLAVVAERVQADTFLACVIMAEIVAEMLDTLVRDYLVERIEAMLSRRTVNGYYPRLGLGPGQRFASKGGYIVRFAEPDGPGLVAEGDWVVP
jgi:hypothetical protein